MGAAQTHDWGVLRTFMNFGLCNSCHFQFSMDTVRQVARCTKGHQVGLTSGESWIRFTHYTVILRNMLGTHTMAPTTLRASYSISAPTLQRFNAVVPPGERSRVIEAYMQQALVAKEQELEAIAAAFMSDPANAEAIEDEKLWDVTIGDGLENIPV